jgi:hypothetical protein
LAAQKVGSVTTYYEAILATIEFMETYNVLLKDFEADCELQGEGQDFFIQLTLPRSCQAETFPHHVRDIPVMLVQPLTREQVEQLIE